MNHQPFLEAILNAPDDDYLKLIFADALEENGESNLAFAYRWAVARRKRPLECGIGVGWCWVTGQGRYGLPMAIMPYMKGYSDIHRFTSHWPLYFRWYYRTERAAYKSLAAGLAKLRKTLNITE